MDEMKSLVQVQGGRRFKVTFVLLSKLVSLSPAMALRSSDDTAAGEGHVVKIS